MGVGLSPNSVVQPQKILVLVASSIWVSIPQTIHNSYPGTSFVYANHFSGALFIKMSRLKNRCLIKFLPMICMPTGSPLESSPQGTEMAGTPAILTGTVQISDSTSQPACTL